jgi:hypothetical protein
VTWASVLFAAVFTAVFGLLLFVSLGTSDDTRAAFWVLERDPRGRTRLLVRVVFGLVLGGVFTLLLALQWARA